MKVFISQPMKDKTEQEIKEERAYLEQYAKDTYGSDIEIIDSYFQDYNPQNGCVPLKYLAKSIQLLADADVAIFGRGWQRARGCVIENRCAYEYGIQMDCAF